MWPVATVLPTAINVTSVSIFVQAKALAAQFAEWPDAWNGGVAYRHYRRPMTHGATCPVAASYFSVLNRLVIATPVAGVTSRVSTLSSVTAVMPPAGLAVRTPPK